MRPIDADNLPEHKFTRESAKGSDYMRDWNDAIDAIVDNAPTVELDESVIQAALNKRCMTAVANEYLIALNGERPQGEWKITEAYPHKVYCCTCYRTYAHQDWEVWKDGSLPRDYCPNCGAKMRKEEER